MEDTKIYRGNVKWFDVARGFGFIASDDVDGDVLLHANVLRNYGISSVVEEAEITFVLQKTDRGHQASKIEEVIVPPSDPCGAMAELASITPEELAALELRPARVKWFNRSKGFGFANVFQSSEDVFIHAEVVRQSGVLALQPGEAVAIKAVDGPRGRMAVELKTWE